MGRRCRMYFEEWIELRAQRKKVIQGFWLEQLGRVEVLLTEIGRAGGAVSREGKNSEVGELPGDPVVRTPRFHCHGPGFAPWLANQDPKSHGQRAPKQFRRCFLKC